MHGRGQALADGIEQGKADEAAEGRKRQQRDLASPRQRGPQQQGQRQGDEPGQQRAAHAHQQRIDLARRQLGGDGRRAPEDDHGERDRERQPGRLQPAPHIAGGQFRHNPSAARSAIVASMPRRRMAAKASISASPRISGGEMMLSAPMGRTMSPSLSQ